MMRFHELLCLNQFQLQYCCLGQGLQVQGQGSQKYGCLIAKEGRSRLLEYWGFVELDRKGEIQPGILAGRP